MADTKQVDAEDHVPEVREPGGYRRSDAEIGRELSECLADDVGLDSAGIAIEVRNGEVTLGGTVRTCDDMHRAEAHACAIAGVVLVHNGLKPRQPHGFDPAAIAGAAAKMGKPGYER